MKQTILAGMICALMTVRLSVCAEETDMTEMDMMKTAPAVCCNGSNVLVIANTAWKGKDCSEVGESEGVARYYMERRKVPESNLLLVEVEEEEPDYAVFHRRVIVPVSLKLKELRGESETDPILYIVCCYGVPIRINPGFRGFRMYEPTKEKERKFNPDGSLKTDKKPTYQNMRAADSFLCYPHVLAKLSEDEVPDAARYDFGEAFQKYDFAPPRIHPYYGMCVQPAKAEPNKEFRIGMCFSKQTGRPMSFAEKRKENSNAFAYYLVCRLDAPTPLIARSLVDKALYAEKFWQNPGVANKVTYHTQGVFDLGELLLSNKLVTDSIEWFKGKAVGSPFRKDPWPMIVDTGIKVGQEIGLPNEHGELYYPNDPNFKGKSFPLKNVGWYYGNYTTYGRYQDVYQWAVGSVGVHTDSGSSAELHTKKFDTFNRESEPEWRPGFVPHALVRNITATSGTVHEPFEDGIISANFLFRALTLGMCFADAAYAGVWDIWWKSIFVGDPLYCPFGGEKSLDKEPPKILSAKAEKRNKDLVIRATTDKPCQFQIADTRGKIMRPFFRWGDTWDDRDWFFGCEHEYSIRLPSAKIEEVILTVRSPAELISNKALKVE